MTAGSIDWASKWKDVLQYASKLVSVTFREIFELKVAFRIWIDSAPLNKKLRIQLRIALWNWIKRTNDALGENIVSFHKSKLLLLE